MAKSQIMASDVASMNKYRLAANKGQKNPKHIEGCEITYSLPKRQKFSVMYISWALNPSVQQSHVILTTWNTTRVSIC